jgi:hypothetical protein
MRTSNRYLTILVLVAACGEEDPLVSTDDNEPDDEQPADDDEGAVMMEDGGTKDAQTRRMDATAASDGKVTGSDSSAGKDASTRDAKVTTSMRDAQPKPQADSGNADDKPVNELTDEELSALCVWANELHAESTREQRCTYQAVPEADDKEECTEAVADCVADEPDEPDCEGFDISGTCRVSTSALKTCLTALATLANASAQAATCDDLTSVSEAPDLGECADVPSSCLRNF